MSHCVTAMVYVVFLLFVLIGAQQEEECDRLGVLIYEDLGCEAEYQIHSKCPLSFICTDWDLTPDTCLYQATRYPVGSKLDNKLTLATCNVECVCRRIPRILSSSNIFIPSTAEAAPNTVVESGIFKCSEWFGKPPPRDCYRTYELGKCSSVSEKCPQVAPVSECEVDGNTFREGEKFFPMNTCLECICMEDFDGSFGEKNCRRQSCGIQLRHAVDLNSYCAPVYLGASAVEGALCCPTDFVCPSPEDQIIQMTPYDDSTNSGLKCRHGATDLQLGEGFKRILNIFGDPRGVECQCLIPPLVTCREVNM